MSGERTDPMTAEHWAHLQTLLDTGLALDPETRGAFVEQQEPALRAELRELLAAAGTVPSFLDAPSPWSLSADGDDLTGREIGPYRVVRELGRGGQGRVLLAERDDLGTEVAIKLLRGGLAAPDLVRRFHQEQRVLAGLDHPGIARLLDAGTLRDAAGLETPYFVMEAIDGPPIDTFADRHALDVDARLALVLQVCDALQFAHERLVVHRDLKPSNLLVTDSRAGAEVKLLDFGVAKLLDATDSVATRTGAGLLTPEYAAPEQFQDAPVTVAADVYSLGVVLYQLLAGVRPYDVSGGLAAAVRVVCDEVPPPPSARVTGETQRRLRGDLDAIAARALAKDPGQRYATVQALADDLRRHRDGRPVQARRPTLRYRTGRYIRRHAAILAAGALVLAGIGGGIVREVSLRGDAERARDLSQATADLYMEVFDAFTDARASEVRVDTLRAEALLERAARRLDTQPNDDPHIQATLRLNLGRTFVGLGHDDRAVEQYRAAIAGLSESDDPDLLAEALFHLGTTSETMGLCRESLDALDTAVRLQQDRLQSASGLAAARASRSMTLACLERYEDAAADIRAAVATFTVPPGSEGRDGAVLHTAADILNRGGYTTESVAAMERSVAWADSLYPRGHPITTARRIYLASLIGFQETSRAEAVLLRAYRESLERVGPQNQWTLGALGYLADVYRQAGRLDEAEHAARARLLAAEDLPPQDVGARMRGERTLALVLVETGRLEEAEAHARASVGYTDRLPEFDLGSRLPPLRTLAEVLRRRGKAAEASAVDRSIVALEARIEAQRTAAG